MAAVASSEVEIDEMSVKDLRALITSAGLSFADCVEKSDLKTRAREARSRLTSSRQQGGVKNVVLSGYECSIHSPSGAEPPDLLVVVLHGFGASNSDFASFPSLSSSIPKRIAWVFPQAPSGNMGATAWWELDAMKWFMAAQQGGGALASLIREEPPGLATARTRLCALVGEAQKMFDLPIDRVVLGGFSQGAMTVMDLALQLDGSVAGVTMISGAPIVVDQWAEKLKQHNGLRVFISHGRNDQVLPFAASGWCRDLLTQGGARVQYHEHGGGHEVGSTTMAPLLEFWSSL